MTSDTYKHDRLGDELRNGVITELPLTADETQVLPGAVRRAHDMASGQNWYLCEGCRGWVPGTTMVEILPSVTKYHCRLCGGVVGVIYSVD
jgi:hypothetical protein